MKKKAQATLSRIDLQRLIDGDTVLIRKLQPGTTEIEIMVEHPESHMDKVFDKMGLMFKEIFG